MPFPNPATQFKPGNHASPGRPKGRSVSAVLREMLESGTFRGKALSEGRTIADMFAEVMVAAALRGDVRFVKEVLDRAEGKPTEKVEVSGPDGRAVAVELAFNEALSRIYGDQPETSPVEPSLEAPE